MAWRDGLQQLMENEWSDIKEQTSYSPEKFTLQVYQAVMSGMARYAGAQAALEYFGVPDPERRAREYGDRKQGMITTVELGLPFVVEDAVHGIRAAKARDMAALGLALADDEEALAGAGGDLVVTTLDDVSLDALAEGHLKRR